MTDTKTAPYAALLLRVSLGLMFLAHGLVLKVFTFTVPGTVGYFQSIGYPGFFAYLVILGEIDSSSKLGQAAERAGISYRHAWNLVRSWEEFFGAPLVVKEQGRGTRLTVLGKRLLWAGQRAQARLAPELDNLERLGELAPDVRFGQLIANLAFPNEQVDFASIHRLVPDPYVTYKRDFDRMPHPRIIKSHECFEPRYPRAMYIVRDPRDVVELAVLQAAAEPLNLQFVGSPSIHWVKR
jgi:molybdate transport repressor ModE-like protein